MTPTMTRDHRAEANRLIGYHSGISRAMTAERTNLESGLIPVSAYIVDACAEAYFRYPALVAEIEAAMAPERIAVAGRRPGVQVNPVYLWSIANFYLVGRKVLQQLPDFADDVEATWRVLDFWERAALAYRGDGHAQAWDAGLWVRPYGDDVLAPLLDSVRPVGSAAGAVDPAAVRRLSATLMSYLFLLYFDTRVGTGDTGPYPLADGRVLIVRDFYRLSTSDFSWSDVAREVPYRNLTAALVLEGVDVKVNDWGTSVTDPEDYLERVVGFGLCTSDTPDGSLAPVPVGEIDDIVAAVRRAQAAHYRNVAAMTKADKIRCGAYVYFTFLRPFAEVAGVADRLDWTVPRDTVGPIWDFCQLIEGDNLPPDPDAEYYEPIP